MRYIFGLFFLISIFAKFITPNDPLLINLDQKLLSPSTEFILGTDYLGRCIFSRLIIGIQITFLTSLFVISLSSFLGLILGIVGIFNKYLDIIILRTADLIDSIPSLIIVLIVTNILGNSSISLGISFVLFSWTSYMKIARNLSKVIVTKEFILIYKVINKSKRKMVFQEFLPNILPQILVVAFNNLGILILSMAGYSFLGFGVKAPYSELGMMINEGKDYINTRPELILVPGIMIFIMVLSINLLGEELKTKYEMIKE